MPLTTFHSLTQIFQLAAVQHAIALVGTIRNFGLSFWNFDKTTTKKKSCCWFHSDISILRCCLCGLLTVRQTVWIEYICWTYWSFWFSDKSQIAPWKPWTVRVSSQELKKVSLSKFSNELWATCVSSKFLLGENGLNPDNCIPEVHPGLDICTWVHSGGSSRDVEKPSLKVFS